jgi:GTP pyrophosphokinase
VSLEGGPIPRSEVPLTTGTDLDALRESLLATLHERCPRVDAARVGEAYDLARLAHEQQVRHSGEPYVTHVASTCVNLVELLENRLDTAVACAALLHDAVEDTPIDLAAIRQRFGEEVATLVDSVTKISSFHFDSAKTEQAENFRKMLLSMAQDLRVMFIKLADRLHNMRTVQYLPPDRAARMARETRDIYAPLAHRLGIARMKRELEDLALKALDPPGYRDIAEKVSQGRDEREAFVGKLIEGLRARLAREGVPAEIQARPKHFYSIYHKMKATGRAFDQIFDLYGLRVLTADRDACYRVLGVVHDLWTPVQERFKDYIATPKSNLYQSLHTTVVVPGGELVEIQIRTREMHRTAETGVAAHYVYKEGGPVDEELDRRLGHFVSQTADWQHTATDEEYLEFLRTALYQEEVFVYTPRRELKRLPRGATPLDFAFHIHSAVGYHCVGARVNGSLVPLRHELVNGDTVEVITSPSARPHQDWLAIVKTTSARSKIRHWLREQHRADALALGREMVDRELRKRGVHEIGDAELADCAMAMGLPDAETMLVRVGQGTLALGQVVRRLVPEKEGLAKRLTRGLEALRQVAKRPGQGVRIHGIDNVMLHFARCCQPVPGDAVVGIVTRGRGVSVHRVECPNTFDDQAPAERRVDVEWNVGKDDRFPVRLLIYGTDRPALLADITRAIAATHVNIRSAGMAGEDRMARGAFLVEVSNVRVLQDVMNAVRRVKGVTRVERQVQMRDRHRPEPEPGE